MISLQYTLLYAIISLFVALLLYFLFHRPGPKLPDLPWLGHHKDESFSSYRAKWRSWKEFRTLVTQGYYEYSKRDLSFQLATITDKYVVLPPSTANWIINQPDSILNHDEPHYDSLQVDHAFPSVYAIKNATHNHTVTVDLTRQLGSLTGAMADEIETTLAELWGNDTSRWKEVCAWDDITQIVARTTNRTFVGLPLCRDPRVWKAGLSFASDVPLSANLLRLFPKFLRPLLAPIITLPNRYHEHIFTTALEPEINRRLSEIGSSSKFDKPSPNEPNDFLQWAIYQSLTYPQGHTNRKPKIIAARLLSLNFAAIHTTSVGALGLLMDLLSSPPSENYIPALRAEAARVLDPSTNTSSPQSSRRGLSRQALSHLTKLDSALRESHRMNTFNNLALKRLVSAPHGLTAPNGTYLPHGTTIAIPAYGVHNDPSIYPEPAKFQPFRFAEMRDRLDSSDTASDITTTTTTTAPAIATGHVVGGVDAKLAKANLSFVTSSPTYLPFGHGRHACLGRFFASAELKLLIGLVLRGYDVELVGDADDDVDDAGGDGGRGIHRAEGDDETGIRDEEKRRGERGIKRPENMWFGDLVAPPVRARIRVRRRMEMS